MDNLIALGLDNILCHSPSRPSFKINPEASSLFQATLFILTRPPFIQLSTFIERTPTHFCGDSLCVISPRLLNRECPQPWRPPSLKDQSNNYSIRTLCTTFPLWFFLLILIQMRLHRRQLSRMFSSQRQRQL